MNTLDGSHQTQILFFYSCTLTWVEKYRLLNVEMLKGKADTTNQNNRRIIILIYIYSTVLQMLNNSHKYLFRILYNI